MERLPELRKTIESADSVMALWIELSVDFHQTYEQKPTNESLKPMQAGTPVEIYGFAMPLMR